MSRSKVGGTAVQGPEQIVNALVRTECRFALDLVQVALYSEACKIGSPPSRALRGPLQAPMERFGHSDGDLGFHVFLPVETDAMQCTAYASHRQGENETRESVGVLEHFRYRQRADALGFRGLYTHVPICAITTAAAYSRGEPTEG